ncbi:hypothetical protein VDG1235_3085 [Verrucomicrobiia bacterium DG1235]|nr:hypothetical protein VDG1235_3085 [Verrucomicrobiae bacterium DG1235]
MMIKKQFCILLAGTLAVASCLSAGPLEQSEIAKDAKWLAHIDMEGLMESSFSDLGVSKLKEVIEESNESAISVDIDLVLKEIKSITAYGVSLNEAAANESVLILKTGDRLQAIFDGFLAHHEINSEEEMPLKRIEDMKYETFLIGDELYLAFPHQQYAIASKSYERIEQAYAVIDGRSDSLKDTKDKLVLNSDSGFFMMVTASGINNLKNVPPQARMLQKTKGGQLSIGESEGMFRANVILTTANRETSLQLFRIVQGMLALASFTQVENQSMMEIVDSVNVQQGDDFVSLDFQYPIERLMGLLNTVVGEMAEESHNGEHSTNNADWQERSEMLAHHVPEGMVRDLVVAHCNYE